MNFRLIMGTIGIALIVCNVPLLFFSTPLFSFILWILASQDVAPWYSLFLLNMTAGLVLYITGRKDFWNSVKDFRISVFRDVLEFRVSSLLAFFGLILTVNSLAFLSFVTMDSGPRTPRDWTVHSLLLVWGVLTFLSGVLWLTDGAKTGKSEILPLKKGIDLKSLEVSDPSSCLTHRGSTELSNVHAHTICGCDFY